MKPLAWFSKAEQRGENISDEFKIEITDKKQYRRIIFFLLAVSTSIWLMIGVHLIHSIFHLGDCLHYGITISTFTFVFTKILPYALFAYKKDSKYPCIIFYAFGVTQLLMASVLFFSINILDTLSKTEIFMGCHNKNQVLTSVLFYLNSLLLFVWAVGLDKSIKIPSKNDSKKQNELPNISEKKT
ncbi:uncharacterized protein LOC130669493 [Microplitis mediator]|uniref:uncharacterized protein LOC130669493 n=1 Tax=Microplitis mediator TaxID=375433 RepID=UPI0025556F23|nr:uncharacterized protein LOC130669493 [Microplitis mediator]